MAATKTSYSVLSLDDAASAAAQRGFGLVGRSRLRKKDAGAA